MIDAEAGDTVIITLGEYGPADQPVVEKAVLLAKDPDEQFGLVWVPCRPGPVQLLSVGYTDIRRARGYE